MNKYNRKRSKEIKQIMKTDKCGRMTYSQARRIWNQTRRFMWCMPCEDCDAFVCNQFSTNPPLVYCPYRR